VATFCNAIANDLPYKVNDPSVQLDLVYIDDLVDEMIAALRGKEHRCDYDGMGEFPSRDGKYCYVPVSYRVSLGEIVHLLHQFDDQRRTLVVPDIPKGSFAKKLYSTFLSYLPESKVAVPLKMNVDARGSFTEVLKTLNCGQFSVNVSNPGITKGQHWHNTKWEFFIVVSGRALIRERKIGSREVMEFEVSGKEMKAVHMLPGYTHSIVNLSESEPLVTLMWANEMFDPERPDTYYLNV
jgi:UDP-2-acetamido-2,6-beta-L-arabino-hexul-4-ose reductase